MQSGHLQVHLQAMLTPLSAVSCCCLFSMLLYFSVRTYEMNRAGFPQMFMYLIMIVSQRTFAESVNMKKNRKWEESLLSYPPNGIATIGYDNTVRWSCCNNSRWTLSWAVAWPRCIKVLKNLLIDWIEKHQRIIEIWQIHHLRIGFDQQLNDNTAEK